MLIELSKLDNMPVGALDIGALVGRVARVAVSPEDRRLIGFLIQMGLIFVSYKVLSFQDVVDIDPSGVTINSAESLIERGEIVRLDKILRYKFSLIGLPVKSKSGESLGRVTDAVIESVSGDIVRIYTRNLFKNLVFERTRIVKMTMREVVVDTDSGRKIKSATTVPGKAPEMA